MKYLVIVILLSSNLLFAQSDILTKAQEAQSAENWTEAAKLYKKHLKKNNTDSSAWFSLATTHMSAKEYDPALEAYQKALDTNFSSGRVYFNTSRIHALRGDKAKLLASLNEGASKGLAAYAAILNDPAFGPYDKDLAFQEALRKIELNAYPCLSNENYRHFDFWLGEWDVHARGGKVGENSITMAKGGCAIHENYTTQGNYAGQSINFYDPIDKLWHQHWVGSSGDTYNYVEIDRGPGMLQFQSEFMTFQGQITLSRLTFTLNDDGTVRQLFESSTDNGETWTPAFDGLYKKKSQ